MIPSCLGLSPASARGLYENGEFLLPEYLDDVKKQTSVMHLRVQDECSRATSAPTCRACWA